MRTLIVLLSMLVISAAFGETARFRAFVMDAETGAAITGKTVTAFFGSREWFGASRTDPVEQLTDGHGMCAFSGSANRSISCVVEGDALWYQCRREVHFTGVSRLMFNRLLPDNQIVTMAVQRVENPIPLHVMKISEGQVTNFFGVGNNTLKYDLVVSDWLPPKGTGVVADVVFERLKPKYLKTVTYGPHCPPKNLYNSELLVTFPGAGNGIVEVKPLADSALQCRSAPETGYVPEIRAWTSHEDKNGLVHSWDDSQVYCFRIRSAHDAEGRLTEGLYGKIYQGIRCAYSQDDDNPIGGVEMTYYLNVNNLDRNLEWDTKNNLNKRTDFRKPYWP